jgi:Zn-dependent M28 family amino/carboxypeptidase
MTSHMKLILPLVLFQLLFLLSPVQLRAQQNGITLSTPEQLEAEFKAVPCRNEDRLNAVKTLFEKVGAPASDISIEKYKEVENVVVTKRGESEEKIVIGAHYDKVSEGCGAVDNWTGIVTLAHLYQTMKSIPFKKTVMFVAFGKEEKGLIGSHAMVNAIKEDQIAKYCAMINIDSLGMGAPMVPDNMSSEKLAVLAADIAKEMKMPFARASIPGADADSSSFVKKKIPALTISGLTNDWPKILHSYKDQASKINSLSVYLGYRLALALAARMDGASCAAYR